MPTVRSTDRLTSGWTSNEARNTADFLQSSCVSLWFTWQTLLILGSYIGSERIPQSYFLRDSQSAVSILRIRWVAVWMLMDSGLNEYLSIRSVSNTDLIAGVSHYWSTSTNILDSGVSQWTSSLPLFDVQGAHDLDLSPHTFSSRSHLTPILVWPEVRVTAVPCPDQGPTLASSWTTQLASSWGTKVT